MARGSITPFPLDNRPQSPPPQDLARSSSSRSNRLSTAAFFFPALSRRFDFALGADRDMPVSRARSVPPSPKSLLSLKLSGPSFLDTVIRDESTKEPLYIIETVREVTTVHRLDPVLSLANKTATVEWPLTPVRIKGKSGRTVQLGSGSWRDVEDFFKVGPLGNTAIRKFQLPHYPHTLKWKLVLGNCFCCTTSGIKGPVAVLDAATLSAPPRLKIYHTLINGEAALSQHNHHGVPTILLDYLIITALLLVTDVQEWLDRPSHDTGGTRIPGSSSYMVQRWLAIIHNRPLPPAPSDVNLIVAVPTSPAETASFPSPSGRWDSQSGTTSASGSNSGPASIFTNELSISPITPATSGQSSPFSSRPPEEIPPVPPMPSQPLSLLPSGSPFAYNADTPLTRLRSRPHSHSPTSSITTPHVPASSHPYAQLAPEPISTPEPARRTHTFSQSYPTPLPSPSQATPASFTPTPPSSSSSTSTTIPRRQLPIPPGPPPLSQPSQPWIHTPPQTSPSTSTAPIPLPLPPTPSTSRSVSASVRSARASMRAIPPPPAPPPQREIPLPPKLAQEYTSPRPRTAPELVGSTRTRESMFPMPTQGSAPLENTRVRELADQMHALDVGAQHASHSLDLGRPPLRVVNADGGSAPAHVQGQGQVRQSYAESVYEMPPPAYDAIDFSVRFAGLPAHPPLPPLPTQTRGQ